MRYLFLMLCLILCSCEYSEPEGKWGDVIKPSSRELFFGTEGGVDSITTKGWSWWMHTEVIVEIEDTIRHEDISYILNEKKYLDGEKYLANDAIYIEGSWFTVNRPDRKKIIFSVNKNETGKKRMFIISLDAGDYGTGIRVQQSAK